MNKYLILIAGCPATGKTYLIELMKCAIPNIFMVTPDEIKETLADSIGYDSKEAKLVLEKKVWLFYYQALVLYMRMGRHVILSEYPFSDKQLHHLEAISKIHEYQVITIRLIGDFEVLWNRRHERDLHSQGHLCHIMAHYHHGDQLLDRSLADDLITKEEFKQIIMKRKYDRFQLGELYEFDVTNFDQVDYLPFINKLRDRITKNE